MMVENQQITVTSSFGVSHTSYIEGEPSIHSLISQADKALYLAKENGRNCVVPYNN